MLIILNCAHTQVEEVVCQNSRTEWSTAVCDSCVAQLGETDNPQPAGADKTATFLLRRMKTPSAGPCSYSLPPLCHALSLSLWKVGPLSSSLFVSPLHRSPLQCPLHISLQWTAACGEHLTRASWGSERELQGSIISLDCIFNSYSKTEAEQQLKHIRTSNMCTGTGTSLW